VLLEAPDDQVTSRQSAVRDRGIAAPGPLKEIFSDDRTFLAMFEPLTNVRNGHGRQLSITEHPSCRCSPME
jgi:hypothetical protein